MIQMIGIRKGDSTVLLCAFVSVLFAAFSFSGGAEYCSLSEFACSNGNCIPNQWKCDEEDDCHDNSDEDHCGPQVCSIPEEYRCSSGQCIPSRWHCDGEPDCTDGSDEGLESCGAVECLSDHFRCGTGEACIPSDWKCDGHEDCATGLDEDRTICGNETCRAEEFMCRKSRRCITSRWVCDLDNDCEDGSDEVNCEPLVCTDSQWQCQTMHCIPVAWHCDGDMDCIDGSDERNCSGSTRLLKPCGETEFTCELSNECIHEAWRCDGDDDCSDGSDERNCGERTCSEHEFQCAITGSCIPNQFLCDGLAQCHDASDERNCPRDLPCDPRTTFDCSRGKKSNCIDISLVCNGRNDCGMAEDEATSLCINQTNPCLIDNGGCSHTCIYNYAGFYCECHDGFALRSDQRTCKDIDECELYGTCSQICENRKGGFKCSCSDGYEYDALDKTCRATGELPFMLIANRHDIRKINLYSGSFHLVIDGLKSAVALDFDYAEGTVFFTDISMETISMIKLANNSPKNVSVIVHHDVSTPDGLAFDWIHKNLYWTDTGNNRIDVVTMSTDTYLRKTLINTNLDEPRAIVVDPRPSQKYMYWSDWGSDAKIEKAFLDGSHRKKLVYKDLQWPNGLAIDYESNLLFWIDAKRQTLSSCDLEGRNQRIIMSQNEYLRHPFSAGVFEDFVFWTDWESESILKVNKFSGSQKNPVKPIAMALHSPMDIRIFHRLKQPAGMNHCLNNECSHICLPSGASSGYACLCPDHEQSLYYLAADGKTCLLQELRTRAQSQKTTVNIKLKDDSTDDDILKENNSSSFHLDRVAQMDVTTNSRTSGQIAGAIMAILTVIFLALFIVAIALYCCHRRRSFRTMNFDNPVYRKTTSEQQNLEDNINYYPALPPTLEPLAFGNTEHV